MRPEDSIDLICRMHKAGTAHITDIAKIAKVDTETAERVIRLYHKASRIEINEEDLQFPVFYKDLMNIDDPVIYIRKFIYVSVDLMKLGKKLTLDNLYKCSNETLGSVLEHQEQMLDKIRWCFRVQDLDDFLGETTLPPIYVRQLRDDHHYLLLRHFKNSLTQDYEYFKLGEKFKEI